MIWKIASGLSGNRFPSGYSLLTPSVSSGLVRIVGSFLGDYYLPSSFFSGCHSLSFSSLRGLLLLERDALLGFGCSYGEAQGNFRIPSQDP
jgi:hypothetical protein